uniref:YitT family protein n=1 Tax=Algoriphagus sp. TaxID=1872435 RepID=UPI0040475865
MSNLSVRDYIKDFSIGLAGVFFAAFALKSFLVPNHFLDGGVTGLALLIHETYHIPISALIILCNLPFIILGGFLVNKEFAIRSLMAVLVLALVLTFVPYPVITSDKLLISIFGGVFLGIGIGLGMRGGCAIDGIEVLALYTLRRSGFSIAEIILGINIILFLIAAIGLGMVTALYAMLTYFIATRTMDYIVEGLEEYIGVTIISKNHEEIKKAVVMQMGKGITVYKGERGFMKDSFDVSHPTDILYTIMTRFEVRQLRNLVLDCDPKAFIFTSTIKEAAGGVILKRKGNHS